MKSMRNIHTNNRMDKYMGPAKGKMAVADKTPGQKMLDAQRNKKGNSGDNINRDNQILNAEKKRKRGKAGRAGM